MQIFGNNYIGAKKALNFYAIYWHGQCHIPLKECSYKAIFAAIKISGRWHWMQINLLCHISCKFHQFILLSYLMKISLIWFETFIRGLLGARYWDKYIKLSENVFDYWKIGIMNWFIGKYHYLCLHYHIYICVVWYI